MSFQVLGMRMGINPMNTSLNSTEIMIQANISLNTYLLRN